MAGARSSSSASFRRCCCSSSASSCRNRCAICSAEGVSRKPNAPSPRSKEGRRRPAAPAGARQPCSGRRRGTPASPCSQLLTPERRKRTILLVDRVVLLPVVVERHHLHAADDPDAARPAADARSWSCCWCRRSRPSSATRVRLPDRPLRPPAGAVPLLLRRRVLSSVVRLCAAGVWLYVAIAAVGWVNPGVYGSTGIYVSELYPTHLRATAVGWFFGIGRIGSFLAPAVVGFMLQYGARRLRAAHLRADAS